MLMPDSTFNRSADEHSCRDQGVLRNCLRPAAGVWLASPRAAIRIRTIALIDWLTDKILSRDLVRSRSISAQIRTSARSASRRPATPRD
jgi:hypothetical protein